MAQLSKKRTYITHDEQLVTCELCGKQTLPKDTYSLIITHAMPGPREEGHTQIVYPGYQCEGAGQHFGCCYEHALISVLACIFHHIDAGEHGGKDARDIFGKFKNETLKQIEALVCLHFPKEENR